MLEIAIFMLNKKCYQKTKLIENSKNKLNNAYTNL